MLFRNQLINLYDIRWLLESFSGRVGVDYTRASLSCDYFCNRLLPLNDYKKTSDITLVDEVGFYYTSPVATGRYGMEEIDLEIISISPSPERERGRYTSHVVFYKKITISILLRSEAQPRKHWHKQAQLSWAEVTLEVWFNYVQSRVFQKTKM